MMEKAPAQQAAPGPFISGVCRRPISGRSGTDESASTSSGCRCSTSIPFFVALYQAFKVLGYAGQNKVFSPAAVRALRTIKYCAMAIIGFVVVGEIFILLGDSDDRAGGVFMGILITFPSIVIATAMVVLERVLQNAVDIKSENDLTV